MKDLDLFEKPIAIAAYYGFGGEAQTHSIVRYLWDNHHHVLLPKMLSKTEMTFSDYTATTVLVKNDFGFYEPDSPFLEQDPYIDIMLIPFLSFDAYGNRLGFGRGHYDRSLGKLRSQNAPMPLKVGLAFEYQQAEHLPFEDHDEKLDAVLLPRTYITFNNNHS